MKSVWIAVMLGISPLLASGLAMAEPPPPAASGSSAAPEADALRMDTDRATNECLSPEEQQRPIDEFSAEQRLSVIACINTAAAQQLNAQLPTQIDTSTRLDRVRAEGAMLIYEYTITERNLPPNLADVLQAMIPGTTCASEPMRATIGLGGSYSYRYFDANGQLITELRVATCPAAAAG